MAGVTGPGGPAGAAGGAAEIAGLLLAAGEGRRFGRAKALIEFDGGRLVDRGVQTLRAGGCVPVLVVTGAVDVEAPVATVVHNRHWRAGMGASLRAGLAAVPPHCAAVVIALVDQPRVTAAAVTRLVAAYRRGAQVAVATYAGRPRNPVLIGRAHFDAVSARAVGDVGARAFLRAHPELVEPVTCDGISDPADIDTPDDLDRLLGTRRAGGRAAGRGPGDGHSS
jgi:CTP:molybdopterin cytidylyltransferase MocA